ncbi:MAG: hypothetical protein U9O94_00545 [Nanoarchaeota archaeon]|nr:hypothetical protein [Nanoarchaeota archaeon]
MPLYFYHTPCPHRVITPRTLEKLASQHTRHKQWETNEHRYDRKVRGIVTNISEIHEPTSYGDIWNTIRENEPTNYIDIWNMIKDTLTNRRYIDFSLDGTPCRYITLFSHKDRSGVEDVHAWLQENYGREAYVRGHYLQPQRNGNRVLPSMLLVDDIYRGPDFKSKITDI